MLLRLRLRHRHSYCKLWRRSLTHSAAKVAEIPSRVEDDILIAKTTDGEQDSAFVTSPDGMRTLRIRASGNTALPVSPILDPVVTRARKRHKQPKPKLDHDNLTPFQKELLLNPYAHALMTPVRRCSFTDAILPTHFLQSFNTNVFAETALPPTPPPPRPKLPQVEYERLKALNELPPRPVQPPSTEPVKTRLRPHIIPSFPLSPRYPGAKSHILLYQPLIKRLSQNKFAWQRLISLPALSDFGLKDRDDWVWRKDMHDVILEKLRKEVLGGLKWGFAHPKAGIINAVKGVEEDAVPAFGEAAVQGNDEEAMSEVKEEAGSEIKEDAAKVKDDISAIGVVETGCRLELKPRTEEEQQALDGPIDGDHTNATLARYNLPIMLGKDKVAELVQGSVFGKMSVVALKKDWRTTATRVSIHKLDAYLRSIGT